jgi:hypothetical protein
MSDLSLFLKKNKAAKENVFFAATSSLCDKGGKPLMWELKALSTKENEKLQDACTREVPVAGKPNMFRHKLDTTAYISKMVVASIVFPDLLNAELQDSYGVKTPEDLVKEIVDNSGEWNEFIVFIQNLNGFNVSLQEEINEAKN